MSKSDMELSYQRVLRLKSPGNIKLMQEKFNEYELNLDENQISVLIHHYIKYLTANQQHVFRCYYINEMDIFDIRYYLNKRSFSDVERTLESATKKFINIVNKEYFGI